MTEGRASRLSAGRAPHLSATRLTRRVGALLVVLVVLGLFSGERRAQWGWAYPGALAERQRYGFVALSDNWRQRFDVGQLGAGWYVDANPPACATSPGGMDRALLIRVRDWNTSPQALFWLESMVDAHPGALWLVGNEPDCIWQDDLLPEDYAQIYYDIYWAIKSWDPTALVSPGGIVQPTPLRLAWLDRVLAQYALIAEPDEDPLMPVDVWNIHNQILQEVRDSWGADIPPGFDDIDEGVTPGIQDNDNVDIFTQQIWDFRAWMASWGYGGYPLIITEYGVLMPDLPGYDFDLARVSAFMDATFEFLRTATSETPGTLGDVSDGHRLVQRWAWYSLDDVPYDPELHEGFNGNLFDPYTTLITGHGLNFAGHTASLPPLEYVELRPGGLWYEPLNPVPPGEVVSREVRAEVKNLGSLSAGAFTVRLAYNGKTNGQLLRPVAGLAAGSSVWVEFDISGLTLGAYTIEVTVDAGEQVLEITECDNELTDIMVVPADIVYLPLTARNH